MNIAYFLIPKQDVAYLYDDFSIRQGLEKMKHHGYQTIPVIDRAGKYVGTVSEGDFLWYMLDESIADTDGVSIYDAEELKLFGIIRRDRYTSVRITATMQELLHLAEHQNFVPVTDDDGSFIGIITRKQIIRYFMKEPPIPQNRAGVYKDYTARKTQMMSNNKQ